MRKNKTFSNIIAVVPGWRYLAIAVFDKYELREWRLKSLAGKDVKGKFERTMAILAGFIERYSPEVLAIKKLHSSRSSSNLKTMTAGIKAYCQKQNIAVFSYSIKELESILLNTTKTNKKELAKLLASEYPVLAHELKREERSRNQYFVRLFEAVALGHVFLKAINNKH